MSSAYHDHPSHPSSCEAYREHYGYGSRCPCDGYKPGDEIPPTTTVLDLVRERYPTRTVMEVEEWKNGIVMVVLCGGIGSARVKFVKDGRVFPDDYRG